jgi:hypothetical protein
MDMRRVSDPGHGSFSGRQTLRYRVGSIPEGQANRKACPTILTRGEGTGRGSASPRLKLGGLSPLHPIFGKPKVAPFSGKHRDADPFITRDGARFYFISDRPVEGKPKEDMDIWYMKRTRQGWGAPKNLGMPINTAASEWFPTVAANGTLYFGSDRPGGNGLTDLYRSRWVGGKFAEPENLGTAINTEHQEYEPYIAPDESYLIFMAIRPDGLGGGDLFISHNRNGTWTRAQNLGEPINTKALEISPKVSPDGKSFFWASSRRAKPAEPGEKRPDTPRNGLGDLYRIDITALPIGNKTR